MRTSTGLTVLASLLWSTTALLVAQDSPCSKNCGNVLSDTTRDDIECNQSRAKSTSAGIVFGTCVECEMRSTYQKNEDTDLKWFLYNMRYATSYCVFGFPENKNVGSNPCQIDPACGLLKQALAYNNLTHAGGPYDYCSKWRGDMVSKCTACLFPDRQHMSNYISLLDFACQQKPAAGSMVAFEGTPFSTSAVVQSTPQPTFAYTAPQDGGPLSLGAKVGVAIGGIVFLLTVAGCCIVCIGRRRRKAYLRKLHAKHGHERWASQNQGELFDTPMSQKPLRGWEDSPISAHPDNAEKTYPRYFSPYSSQYNSPVSGVDGPSMQWPAAAAASAPTAPTAPTAPQWPSSQQEKLIQLHHEQQMRDQQREHQATPVLEIGLALGGSDPSLRSKYSNQSMHSHKQQGFEPAKGKDRNEEYELHEVDSNGSYRVPHPSIAPVLLHPGYGRNPSPPQSRQREFDQAEVRGGHV